MSEAKLFLFCNDSSESKAAKAALEMKGEPCNYYDIRNLVTDEDMSDEVPILYAPEGTFIGWKQIQLFLRIPEEMRHHSLAMGRKMKLDRAIEILESGVNLHGNVSYQDYNKARKLGVEALERVQQQHILSGVVRLPSEAVE